MKSLRDEICLTAGDGGGFHFIRGSTPRISSERARISSPQVNSFSPTPLPSYLNARFGSESSQKSKPNGLDFLSIAKAMAYHRRKAYIITQQRASHQPQAVSAFAMMIARKEHGFPRAPFCHLLLHKRNACAILRERVHGEGIAERVARVIGDFGKAVACNVGVVSLVRENELNEIALCSVFA